MSLLEWQQDSKRVLSPINSRSMLGVEDQRGVFVGAAMTRFDTDAASFWDKARNAASSVAAGRGRESLAAMTPGLQAVLLDSPDVTDVSEFVKVAFAREAMVTNLGVLPFGGHFGELKLSAIWGLWFSPVWSMSTPSEPTKCSPDKIKLIPYVTG